MVLSPAQRDSALLEVRLLTCKRQPFCVFFQFKVTAPKQCRDFFILYWWNSQVQKTPGCSQGNNSYGNPGTLATLYLF